MRIKSPEYIKIINSRITKNSDDFIINYCTEHNQSKSEFVRDAVEHYINYLSKQHTQQIVELTDFDKVFNTEFFND